MKVEVHISLFFVLFVTVCGFSQAQEEAYFAQIKCDSGSSTLTVAEIGTTEPETYKPESGTQTKSMDSLIRIEHVSDLDDYRRKIADWDTTCQLGQSKYEVRISPWNWNNHLEGMCGAGSPDIELTVRRNSQLILNKLIFDGFCDGSWNGKLRISAVMFSELQRLAVLDVFYDYTSEITLKFPFKNLGRLGREDVWRAIKSPDTEVKGSAPK